MRQVKKETARAFMIGAGVAALVVLALVCLLAFYMEQMHPSAKIGAILSLPWSTSYARFLTIVAFGVLIFWFGASVSGGAFQRTKIVLCALLGLGGICYNVAAFKEIDRADLHRLQPQRTTFLAETAVNMPDAYRSGEVLLWLRQNASGSVLKASSATLGLAGLVPHRVMGLALIRVQKPLMEPTLKALPDLSLFKRFVVEDAPLPLFIDPLAAQKGAHLCAVETRQGVIILTAGAVSDCGDAP